MHYGSGLFEFRALVTRRSAVSTHGKTHIDHSGHRKHYIRLLLMAALSFAAMYVLMYAMVDRFVNVLNNLNQVYMAGLMTAPMVVFELLLMRSMYGNKRADAAILLASAVLLVGCLVSIRTQAGITDKQFLRSMIPHHGSAILMCDQASLQDPDIKQLCERIRTGQQAEIDFMKAKLKGLGK
jgi:hypothetical protein